MFMLLNTKDFLWNNDQTPFVSVSGYLTQSLGFREHSLYVGTRTGQDAWKY
jgi:hypothetical protein